MKRLTDLRHERNEEGFYWVPVHKIPQLEKKFKSLKKTAQKLNVDLPIMEFGEVAVYVYHTKDGYEKTKRSIEAQEIYVKGSAPKLSGWELMGRIEHENVDGENVNIIYKVPGVEEIPQKYHSASSIVCEHCGHKRYRKDTFIVTNGKEIKQVGSKCLADFLGHKNPSLLVSYFSSLSQGIGNALEIEEDNFTFGHSGELTWDLEEVLKITGAVIDRFGWKSRSVAFSENTGATADIVGMVLSPQSKEDAKIIKEITIAEHHKEISKKAIEWINQLDVSDNEYLSNLQSLAKIGIVTFKRLGLACSLWVTYLKEEQRNKVNHDDRRKSEYVGSEKDKIEMNVTLEYTKLIATFYGQSKLMKFKDEAGNILVWFASGDTSGFEVKEDNGMFADAIGKTFRIKGTVKKHEEYNGVKQTIITRVKIIK